MRCAARPASPTLPVWFVAFGSGRAWAGNVASAAKQYRNMGVTYSSAGEYGNAIDVLVPTEFDAIRGARSPLMPATPGASGTPVS